MASASEDESLRGNGNPSEGKVVGGRTGSREDTPPAPCSVLCGPRSCSTLPPHIGSQRGDGSPSEPKRRRLWGLRGLVKMFRRRVKRKGGDPSGSPNAHAPTLRARSASEITVDQTNRTNGVPYNQGLSVSHDSVFSPESPTEPTVTAPPSLALATRGVNMAELKAALRRRRGHDSGSGDEDPGLPLSPPTSPTTLDVLNHGLKSYSRTTHSTCSDGSLLSMGSSEMDEDSFGGISNHSSNVCLLEGRCQVVDHEPAAGSAPLSHKAARHKISVKPRRTHGVPKTRRQAQVLSSSLPTTPEVNEDFSAKVAVSSPISEVPYRKHTPNRPPCNAAIVTSKNDDVYTTGHNEVDASLPQVPYQENILQFPPHPEFNRVSRLPTRSSEEASQYRRFSGGKSSRQKSDPSQLKKRARGDEESKVDFRNQNGSSQRSASVEGRLEGHDPPRPPGISLEQGRGGPFRKSSSDALHEVYTSSTGMKSVIHTSDLRNEEVTIQSHHTVIAPDSSYSHVEKKTHSTYSGEVTVQKYSIECLGSDTGTSGQQSSTDSLTSTPLPGIYIRSSVNRSRDVDIPEIEKCVSPKVGTKDEAQSGGPLSLDSSLTLVHHEDVLRKTTSADHVSNTPISKRPTEQSIKVTPSKPVLRSVSVTTPSPNSAASRSRQNSTGDELDSEDLAKISLRPTKKETNLKKSMSETADVPEFMRIQLNKVQNKGNSVIFNTEQVSGKQESSNTLDTSKENTELPKVEHLSESITEIQKEIVDVIIEQSLKIESEDKLPHTTIISESPKQEKGMMMANQSLTNTDSIPRTGKIQHQESISKEKELTKKKEERQNEEIVLRRPSVVDRSVVLDQSVSGHSSPTSTKEEPELFKVFARRSFKLKDSDVDSTAEENQPEIEEPSSPSVVPSSPDTSNSTPPKGNISTVTTISTDPVNLPVPSVKSLSVKRFSLGSSPIPYSTPLKGIEPKPTVLILSGKDSPPQSRSTDNSDPKIRKLTGSQSFKGPSSSQYAVYKSKGNRRTLTADSADNSDASESGSNQSTLTKSDSESTIERSKRNFNRFANGLMGPVVTEKKEAKVLTSLPWQAQETQSEEVIVSHIPPQEKTCLPPSKIINSFTGQQDSKVTEPIKKSVTTINSTDDKNTSVTKMVTRGFVGDAPRAPDSSNVVLAEAKNSSLASSSFRAAIIRDSSTDEGGQATSTSATPTAAAASSNSSMGGPVDDWRVLVRQRREDRRKQTRAPETEELILEQSRPVSRNSKVLEMANNFQKLQVA